MRKSAPRIVAVGDLTADFVVEVPELPIRGGDFQVAERIHLEAGGSSNLLILLSRLGASAVALGALGRDCWGDRVLEILEGEGVDVSSIRRGGTTTVALVLLDAAGDHGLVGTYGRGGSLTFGEGQRRIIAGASALFASGYSLVEQRLRDLTLAALDFAGRRKLPRFFDPGPAFERVEAKVQQRVLASCDHLLLTEEELQSLAPGATRPGTVVVKLGAAGCRVVAGGSRSIEVPGLQVTVRDTTAAGDCFAAGYIWGFLNGRSPEACARLATCAAAAAVGKLGGGRNVPTAAEIGTMKRLMGGGVEI